VLQVCNGYGGSFNDRAFITYGYVPDTPRPPALYGVDRHDFDLDDIWSNNMWTRQVPAPFNACECMSCGASTRDALLTSSLALLVIGPVWVTTVACHCGTCTHPFKPVMRSLGALFGDGTPVILSCAWYTVSDKGPHGSAFDS
jgi:hypothetical protein